MKKFILFIALNIAKGVIAQFGIVANYNVMHVGNNGELILKYSLNKSSISIGAKYLFNNKDNFPIGVVYKKTFWASSFKEHIGGSIMFEYIVFNRIHYNVSLYYNMQFTKSKIKHVMYYALYPLVANPQNEEDFAYQKVTTYIGPIVALENNFGINFNFNLNKNFYITQKIGGGVLFLKNTDKKNILYAGQSTWELSEQFSIGLGYKFIKKEKPSS